MIAFQSEQAKLGGNLLKIAERQMCTGKTANEVMIDLEKALQDLQIQQKMLIAEDSNAKQAAQGQNDSLREVHETPKDGIYR